MIDKYTAQAKSQDEAIQIALKELGISRDQAEITVNEPGKKGFLGIGQKDAVVTVKRKDRGSALDILDQQEESNKDDQPVSTERRVFNPDDYITEGDPQEPRPAREVFPVDEVEEVKASQDSQVQTQVQENTEPDALAQEEFQDQDSDVGADTHDESEAADDELSTDEKDQLAMEEVRTYLEEIIQAMQIEDGRVYTSRVEDRVKYDVETENAGLVIGKHGKVLNGLQTLAQIQLHQRADSKLFAKVDAENYRERRKDTIENIARVTADRVLETGESVALEPMLSHERKQIHRYLYREPGVKTQSKGKEPKRYLVIEPAEDSFEDHYVE